MKRISAILVLGLLLAGCTGKPSDTYTEFISLLEKGELNPAYQLIGKQSRAAIDQRGGVSSLKASEAYIKAHQGIKEIKVTSEKKEGDAASATTVVSFKDGFSGEVASEFVREDGTWKLVVK
jgi:hypothetical protein